MKKRCLISRILNRHLRGAWGERAIRFRSRDRLVLWAAAGPAKRLGLMLLHSATGARTVREAGALRLLEAPAWLPFGTSDAASLFLIGIANFHQRVDFS